MRRSILFLLSILLLVGCQHRRPRGQQQTHVPAGPRQVTIEYLGHTCFLITSSLGLNVLTDPLDRKSTRLNSSHQIISYAVFCLKKKKKPTQQHSNDSQPSTTS